MSEENNKMTAEEREELVKKFREDSAFLEAVNNAQDIKEIYDLYVKHGYTNLDYETFSKALEVFVSNIDKAVGRELSEEELEQVVGGAWKGWNIIKKIAKCIPVVGPLVQVGEVIANKDKATGDQTALRITGGVLGSAIDVFLAIGTAGASTAVQVATTLIPIGISAGSQFS